MRVRLGALAVGLPWLILTSGVATAAAREVPACVANPVIDADFADPAILRVDGRAGPRYFAYATNVRAPGGARDINVQVRTSRDLLHWSAVRGRPDALPALPAWASPGRTWAPKVTRRADRKGYVAYFTARDRASGRECIGVATGSWPAGPFRSRAPRPLVCPVADGGAIDPSAFHEGGRLYLLWKVDGNCCGKPTPIYLRELTADGRAFKRAKKVKLLDHDLPWEGDLVEAPALWKHAGRYVLFYSGNSYARGGARDALSAYATGYALSWTLRGPYEKAKSPLLSSSTFRPSLSGPGGPDVVKGADGRTWLAYHAWSAKGPYRALSIDRLDWVDGAPRARPRCP